MLTDNALLIAVICVVIAMGMMVMTGCEIKEGMKSDRTSLEGCEPTNLYVYESNPRGVHQIYECV